MLGLNTKQHPARLHRTNEGNIELAEAVNVDVSDRFKPYRRPGQRYVDQNIPGHSFYSAGDFALFVSGSQLLKLSASLATSTLRSGLNSSRMSFTEQGGKIFYANGYQKGFIEDNADKPWVASTSHHASQTTRTLGEPPVGHKLATLSGRIFIAQDNVLWFTEAFKPFIVDLGRNAILFDSRIKELVPVADGLFVSTSTKTVFLQGPNVKDMVQRPVLNFPLIPGTVAETEAEAMPDLLEMGVTGLVSLATGSKGICVFGAGGFKMNLSQHKVDIPTSTEGSAYIYNGKYVVNLQ